jgi:hypothetical protein
MLIGWSPRSDRQADGVLEMKSRNAAIGPTAAAALFAPRSAIILIRVSAYAPRAA